MNKNEFLLKLAQSTNKEDGERLYNYYSEIIEDRIEAGEDEMEIIAGLGDIDKIIQESEASRKVKEFEEKPRITTGFKALMAVLFVFASPLLLAIILPIGGVIFAIGTAGLAVIFALVVSFLVTGAAGILSIIHGFFIIFTEPIVGLLGIGSGLIALGVGIIFGFFTYKLLKLLIAGIKKLFGIMIQAISKKKRGGITNEI